MSYPPGPSRKPPQLTLVGFRVFDDPERLANDTRPRCRPEDLENEDPFPLTRYADVHVYTPSRERRTILPPPLATGTARAPLPTVTLQSRHESPSASAHLVAAVAVLFALAAWVMLG